MLLSMFAIHNPEVIMRLPCDRVFNVSIFIQDIDGNISVSATFTPSNMTIERSIVTFHNTRLPSLFVTYQITWHKAHEVCIILQHLIDGRNKVLLPLFIGIYMLLYIQSRIIQHLLRTLDVVAVVSHFVSKIFHLVATHGHAVLHRTDVPVPQLHCALKHFHRLRIDWSRFQLFECYGVLFLGFFLFLLHQLLC